MKRLSFLLILTLAGLLFCSPAFGAIFQGNYTSAQTLGPGHFELGLYGTYLPAKSLGLWGYDGGLVGGKLEVGILDFVDVGGCYAVAPIFLLPAELKERFAGMNFNLIGGQVKVRLMNESAGLPAVAIIGDYFDFKTVIENYPVGGTTVDAHGTLTDCGLVVLASKTIGPFVPFASLGYRFLSVKGEAEGVPIEVANIHNTYMFSAGLEWDIGFLELVAEAMFIEQATIFGGGVNIQF